MDSNSTITSSALPIDYVIDSYRIIRKIGQGGFGITYLAEDIRSGEKVVIKENFPRNYVGREQNGFRVLPDGKENQECFEWTRKCFLNEARVLDLFDHPNIVKVANTFEANNTVYLVMPYIEGCSLTELYPIDSPRITESALLSLLRTLLGALQHLHNKGITHRDIKPDNILMSNAEPILIDFGTARNIYSAKTATQVGTSGFAPPEQLDENNYERKPKPRIDLYALGATCYYLMTGKYPQQPASRLLGDDMIQDLRSANLKSRYSSATLSGVVKALALKPDKRWQSAQDWLNALPSNKTRQAKNNYLLPFACGLLIFSTIGTLSYLSFSKNDEKEVVTRQKKKVKKTPVSQPKNNSQDTHATDYNTDLLEAAKTGNVVMLRTAIAAEANVNQADEDGETPLHKAAEKGHTRCVELLIEAKADVNQADEDGYTPLYEAAYYGHAECVKLLIAIGADVNKANNLGYTPLYGAAGNGNAECVKLLIDAMADINKADKDGYTPLYGAAQNGHTECVKLLITAGADVNTADKDGSTPLKAATTEEIKQLLRTAIKEVAKSRLQQQNITPEKYDTALLEASQNGNSELITLLITAGADVNTADQWGWTPLFWAARYGHTECVKLLIDAKADVNKANNYGETPLYRAAWYGYTECTKLLIATGADVNKAHQWGRTPLYEAAHNGYTECVKLLIAAGADVNKADEDGYTPLHGAAYSGRTECVKLLIAAGADVNKADKRGWTSLNVAKTEEIKQLLRASGAR